AASGERTRCTCGRPETVCTTSFTAARNEGSETVCDFDWTSTLSEAWFGNPARSSSRSAVRVPPAAVSACLSIFVPAAVPLAIATTQKTSHAPTAVFQCLALHRPARAAMLKFIVPPDLVVLALRLPFRPVFANGGSRRRRVRLPAPSRGANQGSRLGMNESTPRGV